MSAERRGRRHVIGGIAAAVAAVTVTLGAGLPAAAGDLPAAAGDLSAAAGDLSAAAGDLPSADPQTHAAASSPQAVDEASTHEAPTDASARLGPVPLAQTDADDPLRAVQWALDRLRAEQAWETTDAAGQTIAVVDSGVQADHPDLEVAPGVDILGEGTAGLVDESELGHGTGVAGVAGAIVGNGVGIAGLAPDVELFPVRVLRDRDGDEGDIIAGVYAASVAGADVINLSVGTRRDSPELEVAVEHARRRGAVVVASSGNSALDGNPRVYPAAYDRVVGVGATTRDDQRAVYSNYGDWLTLTAPGGSPQPTVETGVVTTCPAGARGCPDAHGYAVRSGTSFAAPHVSATAALVRARHPRALPSQVAHRLTATAEDLGRTGFDPEFGHGLVDPVAAVTELPELGCRTDTAEPVARLWDVARVETAVAGGCTHWDEASEVVLATARDFPDALAGAALAAARDVPLLLTEPGEVRPHLDEALLALEVEAAVLLGGERAVTPAVESTLGDLGVEVTRLAGADRYATAAATARAARAQAAPGSVEAGGTVIVASGEGFADAVAAGALFAAEDDPVVLLTRRDRVPDATSEALTDLAPDRVLVIGGERAVSASVVDALGAYAGEVARLAGGDRYETSAEVALTAHETLGPGAPLLAVTGAAFPDALTAGALAGRLDAAVVLVPPGALPAGAPARDVAAAGWSRAEVVGGRAAVSDAVAAALADALAR